MADMVPCSHGIYTAYGECPICRFCVVRNGFRWSVRTGTGTRLIGNFWRKITAQRLASELTTAYCDGIFIGQRGPSTVGTEP